MLNPYRDPAKILQWRPGDWDRALRFWSLVPFDPQLGEWLKSVDTSLPSILAAREFAAAHTIWDLARDDLLAGNWLEPADLAWQPDKGGWNAIKSELGQLQQLMEDDRERYLDEIEAQADGLADYTMAFIGASQARHPWTVELISCGLAISNIAYMRWKSVFRRVRPSTLCPGLIPALGPPAHPAFPSGHSTAGHFVALLLLEIPAIAERFGVFAADGGPGAPPALPPLPAAPALPPNPLAGTGPHKSPLLWLAARLAKNRERLGVHYASDSYAGRHLAASLWRALLHGDVSAQQIDCPTLGMVLDRARSEWPLVK